MKKTVLMLTAVLLILSALTLSVSAQDINVNVSIINGGIKLANVPVSVSDSDGDGKITIADALYCAHEQNYEGGAPSGFDTAETEFGLSLTMLWGNNSGAFGYCVNDTSAMSLADAVTDGDYVCAYVYTDTDTFSDVYGYFDKKELTVNADTEFSLGLAAIMYDADFNPVVTPVAEAQIYVDGEKTESVTDQYGNVKLTLSKGGKHIITAKSQSMTLVAPVCNVTVEGGKTAFPIAYVAVAVVLVALAVAIVLVVKRNAK